MLKKWLICKQNSKIRENNSRDFLKICDMRFKVLYRPFNGLSGKEDAE